MMTTMTTMRASTRTHGMITTNQQGLWPWHSPAGQRSPCPPYMGHPGAHCSHTVCRQWTRLPGVVPHTAPGMWACAHAADSCCHQTAAACSSATNKGAHHFPIVVGPCFNRHLVPHTGLPPPCSPYRASRCPCGHALHMGGSCGAWWPYAAYHPPLYQLIALMYKVNKPSVIPYPYPIP